MTIQKFINENVICDRVRSSQKQINFNFRQIEKCSERVDLFSKDGLKINYRDCEKVINSPVGTPHLVRFEFCMTENDLNPWWSKPYEDIVIYS